jgi:hypothetical protein
MVKVAVKAVFGDEYPYIELTNHIKDSPGVTEPFYLRER